MVTGVGNYSFATVDMAGLLKSGGTVPCLMRCIPWSCLASFGVARRFASLGTWRRLALLGARRRSVPLGARRRVAFGVAWRPASLGSAFALRGLKLKHLAAFCTSCRITANVHLMHIRPARKHPRMVSVLKPYQESCDCDSQSASLNTDSAASLRLACLNCLP